MGEPEAGQLAKSCASTRRLVRVVATIVVGGEPFKLQPADGWVRVRTAEACAAIDPDTNQVAATLAKADVGRTPTTAGSSTKPCGSVRVGAAPLRVDLTGAVDLSGIRHFAPCGCGQPQSLSPGFRWLPRWRPAEFFVPSVARSAEGDGRWVG
jgi:hypothetical protein